MAYNSIMDDKDLVWLHGEVKTPPFSAKARQEAGFLLRQLQQGVQLPMPQSRPMPTIGANCHELRVKDEQNIEWRVLYHIDSDAIVVLDVFKKQTSETPEAVKTNSKTRLSQYRRLVSDHTKNEGKK